MGAIFLSHSSVDKMFVRKLALDLLQLGFEIWFDEWNMQVGSKLSERIKSGVDESSFVIVVMSEAMRASGWVEREIDLALDIEAAEHRDIILPIRIDTAAVPDKIADRLYADFSQGAYQRPLEMLCAQLHQHLGEHPAGIAPERELIPLFVRDGTELDASRLETRVAQLAARYGQGYRIFPAQLRLCDEPELAALRDRIRTRLDNIGTDVSSSVEFELVLRTDYESVSRMDARILPGLAKLINHRGLSGRHPYAYEAYRWFWRRARVHVIGYLYRMQDPAWELPEFGYRQYRLEFAADPVAAVYGVESTDGMAIGDLASGREYSFEADRNSPAVTSFGRAPFVGGLIPVWEGGPGFVDKWVVPQILWRSPDFDDWDSVDDGLIGLR